MTRMGRPRFLRTSRRPAVRSPRLLARPFFRRRLLLFCRFLLRRYLLNGSRSLLLGGNLRFRCGFLNYGLLFLGGRRGFSRAPAASAAPAPESKLRSRASIAQFGLRITGGIFFGVVTIRLRFLGLRKRWSGRFGGRRLLVSIQVARALVPTPQYLGPAVAPSLIPRLRRVACNGTACHALALTS